VQETQNKKILLIALNQIEDGSMLPAGAGRSQVQILSPRLPKAPPRRGFLFRAVAPARPACINLDQSCEAQKWANQRGAGRRINVAVSWPMPSRRRSTWLRSCRRRSDPRSEQRCTAPRGNGQSVRVAPGYGARDFTGGLDRISRKRCATFMNWLWRLALYLGDDDELASRV
jgi:hypothetical protein